MKAKATVLIVLTFSLSSLAQVKNSGSPVQRSIRFDKLQPQYRKFEEIKPKLVNASGQSIYLKWTYPHGAHLKRLNEQTGEWEEGGKGINCAAGVPELIEVKAGESKDLDMHWELSTDDFKDPKFFELADHKTQRPLSGRYKIYIPYAVEVWAWGRRPGKVYYLESPGFSVVW